MIKKIVIGAIIIGCLGSVGFYAYQKISGAEVPEYRKSLKEIIQDL